MGESRRRRFAVLSLEDDALDRLTQSDEHFFARTGRSHRLRLAGRAEVEALRRVHGADAVQLGPDERLFAVVRVPFDGAHLKQFIPNRADSDVDVPEAFASGLFDHLASRGPEIDLLEHTLRRMAAGERQP